MVVGLTPDGVALGGQQPVQGGVDLWPVGLHSGAVQRADVVEVDVNRQPIQREMEDIQRRPTLQDQAVRQDWVAGDLLQHVEKAQDLLERTGLQAGLVGETLQGLSRRCRHAKPSKLASRTASGRITRHLGANRLAPAVAPRA